MKFRLIKIGELIISQHSLENVLVCLCSLLINLETSSDDIQFFVPRTFTDYENCPLPLSNRNVQIYDTVMQERYRKKRFIRNKRVYLPRSISLFLINKVSHSSSFLLRSKTSVQFDLPQVFSATISTNSKEKQMFA